MVAPKDSVVEIPFGVATPVMVMKIKVWYLAPVKAVEDHKVGMIGELAHSAKVAPVMAYP